jgi:hypothetical protein
MKSRAISTWVGLVGLSVCLMAQTSWADNIEVVIKYGGTLYKAINGTGPHEVFRGLALPNGQPVTLAIANADESKPTYAPDPKVEAAMKEFKPGDFIDIVCAPGKMASIAPLVQTATAYAVQPGEEDPHGYVFEESFTQKHGNQDTNIVTLSRFKQKAMYLVPTHLDGGDVVADDVMLGIVGKLQPKQVVYAQVTGGPTPMVTLLAPWANHFTGKFVKFDEKVAVDTDNDMGPAVELTDSTGKAVTALIPGTLQGKRWVPQSPLMTEARRLKPGSEVDFITADSGDNRIWLVNIATPKPEKAGLSRNTQ